MARRLTKILKVMRRSVSKAFLICIVLRMFSVWYIQTSFVPDEYWQSLEVAHKMAFEYGYLTWEWRLGIRSYFHPAIFALMYKIMAYFEWDTVNSIVLLPRLAQALLSIVSDYLFVKWHQKTTGCRGNWAWFTVTTSWFWFYCASRTLSNTLETCLATIGLYLYPWEQVVLNNKPKRSFLRRHDNPQKHTYLWIVAIACALRPTAAIFWFPLVAFNVAFSKSKKNLIFFKCFPIAATVLAVSYKFDSYFHGEPVFTWWNFFAVNVLKDVGEFYGSETFFWYFVVGFPTVLGALVVPFGLSVMEILHQTSVFNMETIMTVTGIWTIGVLSLLSHKELRFLLPIFPLCFHMTASWLSHWSRRSNSTRRYAMAFFIAGSSIVAGVFLGHFHQRGTLDVMKYLAKESRLDPSNTNLLFLMPCHSTPLYSHLHINVPARFLTCEPDVFDVKPYVDEAEVFFSHPEGWLNQTFPANSTEQVPTHIIMFDPLRQEVSRFLNAKGYLLAMSFHHTIFPTGRVGNHVLVFKQVKVANSWPGISIA